MGATIRSGMQIHSFSHRVRVAVLVSMAAFVTPLHAFASGDAGGGDALFWQAVNLAIVLGVLFYFGRKPVSEFFTTRRAQISSDLESAATLLKEAETRNSEIQRRLIELESQLEDIRETTRRRAEEESERILAEANKTAARIQSDATAAVDQELMRAQRELRKEAAGPALELAGNILREQVSEADRDRLLDEFITRVEPGVEAGQ
jgi:F-type H+-transporting ATPase subunit b